MSESTTTKSSIAMAVLLALHAMCGVALLRLLLKLVPQYVKIFQDFNAKLPNLTIMVIDLSRILGMYWFVLVSGLAAGDIAIMLSLNYARRPPLMIVWGVLVWLAEMLLIGVILPALIVPLDALITNLSK